MKSRKGARIISRERISISNRVNFDHVTSVKPNSEDGFKKAPERNNKKTMKVGQSESFVFKLEIIFHDVEIKEMLVTEITFKKIAILLRRKAKEY